MSNIERLKRLQQVSHEEAFKSEILRHTDENGALNPSWWWISSNNRSYIRHTFPFAACKEFWSSLKTKTVLNLMDGKGGCEANYFKSLGHEAASADIAIEALAAAKASGFIDRYYQEDAESLSFDDESFDYVVVKEALHHLPRPYMSIYEMIRVAEEGVYIVEPNDSSYSVGAETYEQSGNFKFSFSRKELVKVFIAMGYCDIFCRRLFEVDTVIQSTTAVEAEKEVREFHEKQDSEQGQFECIFCFKKLPSEESLNKLKHAGWSRLDIQRNNILDNE